MIKFHVLTLFPNLMESFSNTSIIKKGLEKKAFEINIKDIRENAINRYGQVDDLPYGGGPGMVLRPEPIINTYNSLNLGDKNKICIYFSPKGRKITNSYIIDLTKFHNIVLISGHYEGIDQRVIDLIVDEEVSLGDFVLTGGEIPTMALIDAVSRHIDDVIKKESLQEESFTGNLLEYRHYTRPKEYMGLNVPEVLMSGNHKEIDEYRLFDSVNETLNKRPDLIANNKYSEKINKIIKSIKEGKKI